ncbi:hypothetical protein P280DRAFT_518185 [Massarina eburnea CBS 473.64]|uniref:Arrestin-like N-terminal domain-containing protein n=1 Tax=Massarina eburnea CBS 473.64 TaxID=1395130 RepID=A0A6A6S0X8_9PLEO|nr:hypothetical protein P280DRAFT_518185 [Massarina eburnea CBS 473.64]
MQATANPPNVQKLLSTFPMPPTGPPSRPGSTRAANFGFIPVSLSRDDDSDSLYDYPEEPYHGNIDPAAKPLPSINGAELQLVLDNPSKTYAPSETITGYILGWEPATTHLHIIFEGRAKTYVRRDKVQYKDRAPLLYQITHLKPEAQGVIPRFSITVPERAASGLKNLNDCAPTDPFYGEYWTNDWPKQDPYEQQAGHPLPPTMSMPIRSATALGSFAEGWGHITYKLIAVRSQIDTTTGKPSPLASCQVTVRLTTRRLVSEKVQELMRNVGVSSSDLFVQTAQLLKQTRLSLREQLRDTFSSSAPSFYFRGNISVPTLSIPGADLKASMSITILPPPPGKLYNFALPDISITALNFRVRSYTGIRIMRRLPDEQQATARTQTFRYDELRTSQSPSGATFQPKDGGFDGQACVSTITLPKNILPSCKTYNIWRSYRVRCDAVLSVAGKEVNLHSKSDLNIVANPRAADDINEGPIQELRGEDDAVSLEIAQAMVRMGGGPM